jgi:hypothetical protein
MEQVLTHRARLKTYPFNRIWKRAKARSDTSIPAKYSISNLPCSQLSCDLNGSSTSEQRAAQLRMLWAVSDNDEVGSGQIAAPCTFRREGRKPDLRCRCERYNGDHGNRTFAALCIEVCCAGLSATSLHSRQWLFPEN